MWASLSALSRASTICLLDISILIVFVFGGALALGLVGELRWESDKNTWRNPWGPPRRVSRKKLYKICEIIVIAGVLGELIGDTGVFFFSDRLQTLDEATIAGIQENGPRILGDEQRTQLIGFWSKYGGKPVQLSRIDDSEAINLANEVLTILTKANLRVSQVPFSSGQFVFGVMIGGPLNEPALYDVTRDLNCAEIFSVAFPSCGIPGVPATSSFARSRCDLRIDIGLNPMGKRWKQMAELGCKQPPSSK